MSIQAIADVLEHSEFANKQRLIQIVLANYADENRACWPSIMRIEKEGKINQRSIYRHLTAMSLSPEIAIVKHGAKLYYRAHSKHRRNSLYFVLTNVEEKKRIGIKAWAWQQNWATLIGGESFANLSPFEVEEDFAGHYYDRVASMARKLKREARGGSLAGWHKKDFDGTKYQAMVEDYNYKDIHRADALLEPISHEYEDIKYITAAFLLNTGLINDRHFVSV